MVTLVIRHDLDIASEIDTVPDDLTVVSADDEDAVLSIDSLADVFVAANSTWEDIYLEVLTDGAWVQTTSKGVDNFPVERFEERGITFTNAAGNHGVVVAEHVFALVLAISRRLPDLLAQQQHNEWDRSQTLGLTDWNDRTLTVLGLGEIGEDVARRGQAFNMVVNGVKRSLEGYDGCVPEDNLYPSGDFQSVLPETDLLVVAVPYNDETHNLIDADVLAQLPSAATVINVSRGGVVDEPALIDALEAGVIAAAGLDVFETEPLPPESPLWEMENVIVTPHVGGRSDRFAGRFADLLLENYDRWRRGEELKNRVV